MVSVMASIRALIRKQKENFPVASWVLPWRYRRSILAFYRFARHADDIADDPAKSRDDKHIALKFIDEALGQHVEATLPDWAVAYFELTQAGVCDVAHGRALLSAFMQDADKQRYASWDELIDYCRRSAAPVGRTVLEICGETEADLAASDALCNALQVMNHLQDCGRDYRLLDRIYLPQDWMTEAGARDAMLAEPEVSSPLRAVLDRCLTETAGLLRTANSLPGSINSWQLRIEVRIILFRAWALTEVLRGADPLAKPVKLSARQRAICIMKALSNRPLPS